MILEKKSLKRETASEYQFTTKAKRQSDKLVKEIVKVSNLIDQYFLKGDELDFTKGKKAKLSRFAYSTI